MDVSIVKESKDITIEVAVRALKLTINDHT